MNRGYNLKTRQIQKSLHRRARMRRAYFKMLGENTKGSKPEAMGGEIDLSDVSDSDNEDSGAPSTGKAKQRPDPAPKSMTPKQKASQKRAAKYIKQKQEEERLQQIQSERLRRKRAMTERTTKGQPRLGAQVGVLLDKIKKSQ